ncbi:hypothetical protein EIN_018990 [Entamoeba invadens IP1]|uniref:hypothetical protein n=1 Tax=Entamoeba invadens IP1 TaxID=370355 RepID=UPI0002C3F257|nr:hypothetical protein EIN_018990 [Entamoeba invadens IP1]ELP90530.1 hypothetical protein EIN_018990 [Entamoeba invadens IP1]|eukprot:XP_004257301.1 hypothetical protein EIN_018990 [Entamoeba invadens IP1]
MEVQDSIVERRVETTIISTEEAETIASATSFMNSFSKLFPSRWYNYGFNDIVKIAEGDLNNKINAQKKVVKDINMKNSHFFPDITKLSEFTDSKVKFPKNPNLYFCKYCSSSFDSKTLLRTLTRKQFAKKYPHKILPKRSTAFTYKCSMCSRVNLYLFKKQVKTLQTGFERIEKIKEDILERKEITPKDFFDSYSDSPSPSPFMDRYSSSKSPQESLENFLKAIK